MRFLVIFLFTVLPTVLALAQTGQVPTNIKPEGIGGAVGAGFVDFTIDNPSADFKLDQGIFASIYGEKAFDFMQLYLTISLSYLKTEGQANYDYTTIGGQHYEVTDIAFDTNLFQAGLGLKFKLLDDYFFRPYIEGGGIAGYYEIRYKNKSAELQAQGSDYKSKDSLFDGGKYAEGGVEISFSEQFGLRIAARFTENKTKKFDTLGKQSVEYKSSIYYLSALINF